MSAYAVTGACVVVPGPGGQLVTLYAGSVLPDEVPASTVKHLLESGLVTKTAPLSAVVVGTEAPSGDPAGGTSGPGEGGRPALAEAKAAWVAYAESQGVPTEEAEALTKAELVERFKA